MKEKSYSIVIIDDDEDFVSLLKKGLQDIGHRVRGYSDIDEFFRGIRTEPPEVALVDLVMPEMPGWKLIQKLRNAGIPGLKIVAMSAILETDDTERMQIEADAFVPKPLQYGEMEKLVWIFDSLFAED